MKSSDSSDSTPHRSVKRLEDPRTWWTVTAAIALAGFAVRAGLLGESLWIDELHSAWTISGSWSEVAGRAAQGNNLPTYFWFLYSVSSFAGHSETVLRLPSLVASLTMLIGMAWIVRRWTHNPVAGWIAAACMTLDRDFVFFSVEARPYAAVQLLTAGLLTLTPTLALAPTVSGRSLAVALQAASFYLHPTAALTWPAVVLARWAGLWLRTSTDRDTNRRTIRRTNIEIATDTTVLLLLLVPATPLLVEIFQRRDNWQSISALAPSSASISRAIGLLHLGIYAVAPIAGWLGTAVVQRCRTPRSNSSSSSPAANNEPRNTDRLDNDTLGPVAPGNSDPLTSAFISCWLWALVPLGIVLLTTRLGWAPLLMLRYVWSAKLGAICGASIGIAALPSRFCRSITAAALIVCVAWKIGPSTPGPPRICETWREALATIAQLDPHGDDIVLIRAKLIEAGYLHAAADITHAGTNDTADNVQQSAWRAYLAFPLATQIYPLPHSAAQKIPLDNDLSPSITEFDQRLLAQAPSVWLVARGSRDETQSVLESIERQLRDLPASWHRSVDSSGPCLRLVRWTRSEARQRRE